MWPYATDNQDTVEAKKQRFDNSQFPIVFVKKIVKAKPFPKVTSKVPIKDPSTGKLSNTSMEYLLKELGYNTMSMFYNNMIGKEEDLQLKSTLINTQPPTVKIGRKEGVFTEQLFYVMEIKQNAKGETKYVRKGAIRAGAKITDNRQISDGDTPPTAFTRVAGFAKFEPSMLIREKPSPGFGFQVFPISISENFGTGMDLNASKHLAQRVFKKGFLTGLHVGANLIWRTDKSINNTGEAEAYSNSNVYLYLRKDIYFMRGCRLGVYAGTGTITTRLKSRNGQSLTNQPENKVKTIPTGIELGLALHPAFDVFANAEYNIKANQSALRLGLRLNL